MIQIPTYEIEINEWYRTRHSVACPGLGWQTVLQAAVRDYYAEMGASQARFVEVTRVIVVGPLRRRALVRTSRFHELTVLARPWATEMADV